MHTDILFTIWTVVELLLMCCCENYMSYTVGQKSI